jgi:hypothetical protein
MNFFTFHEPYPLIPSVSFTGPTGEKLPERRLRNHDQFMARRSPPILTFPIVMAGKAALLARQMDILCPI